MSQYEIDTRRWLQEVVLGLNLCPFAHQPARREQIRFTVCGSKRWEGLSEALIRELRHLNDTPPETVATTLLIHPFVLTDFYYYCDFLEYADTLLDRLGFAGVFQIASFHPDYQFQATEPEDPTNYTNRSPYPLLHLLRENELSAALARYPDDPAAIPERNQQRMRELSQAELRRLFSAKL